VSKFKVSLCDLRVLCVSVVSNRTQRTTEIDSTRYSRSNRAKSITKALLHSRPGSNAPKLLRGWRARALSD
jgi:hypothetical protein